MTQGMARLKACFHPDLNFLPEWRRTQPTVIMEDADALTAVLLVRAAGDEEMLPATLYVCSGLPPMVIAHHMWYGDEEVKLSHQDQPRCLEAIPQLLAMRGRIVDAFLRGSLHDPGEEPGPCAKRGVCRKMFHLLAMQAAKDQIRSTTRFFSSLRPWVDKTLQVIQQQLFTKCREALSQELTTDTHTDWCELGNAFGLPDWILQQGFGPEKKGGPNVCLRVFQSISISTTRRSRINVQSLMGRPPRFVLSTFVYRSNFGLHRSTFGVSWTLLLVLT